MPDPTPPLRNPLYEGRSPCLLETGVPVLRLGVKKRGGRDREGKNWGGRGAGEGGG